MGYTCPVCATPYPDGEHLANHLAVTAILHEADHETWLDTHVADWEPMSPATLASHVTDQADETEFEPVFDDTTPTETPDPDFPPQRASTPEPRDPQTQRIIEDARSLTERRRDETKDE